MSSRYSEGADMSSGAADQGTMPLKLSVINQQTHLGLFVLFAFQFRFFLFFLQFFFLALGKLSFKGSRRVGEICVNLKKTNFKFEPSCTHP